MAEINFCVENLGVLKQLLATVFSLIVLLGIKNQYVITWKMVENGVPNC